MRLTWTERAKLAVLALVYLCFFGALRVWGAAGDIKSAQVEANGWVLAVTVDTIGTFGTLNFGFGTNYSGPSKVVVSVTSLGFGDAGQPATHVRRLYGTKELRLPYPNQATRDVQASGNDAVIRMALSDYVYGTCSNLTVSIGSNWFSNNAACSGLTVANNSLASAPKPIANWSWPGFQRVTGNTMTLRAVGFHRSGQEGRPLRAMRFVATGATSGVAVTNFVTRMTVDRSLGDAVPVCEYVGTLDVSGMTQGERVRCDFTAYPWLGTNTLDTMDNAYSYPTANYASMTNVCDRLGTYGVTRAIVDETAANDTAGVAAVETYWATNQNPAAFKTINGARVAIAGTNLTFHGRNDMGAAELYFKAGQYAWTGGSATLLTNCLTWCLLTPAPGVARSSVIVTNQVGRKFLSGLEHFFNVTFTQDSTPQVFDGPSVWVEKCFFTGSANRLFYRGNQLYYTQCVMSNWPSQYFKWNTLYNATSNPSNVLALVRGCDWSDSGITSAAANAVTTILGNIRRTATKTTMLWQDAPANGWQSVNPIYAYNAIYNQDNSIPTGNYSLTFGNTSTAQPAGFVGWACVQNLFENVEANCFATVWLFADACTLHATNVLVWNNTIAGQRFNAAYNDTGTAIAWRDQWTMKNNLADFDAIKTDIFGTGNANRTGNWAQVWAVGNSGGFGGQVSGVIADSFIHSNSGGFYGLNGFQLPGNIATKTVGYVNRLSWQEPPGTTASGLGDYRHKSSSLQLGQQCEWLLPYDLEGNARSLSDPPGAYGSAVPRKCGGFF